MFSQRHRPVLLAAAALLFIWVAAIAGYKIAQNAKVTPDKVRTYIADVDFGHLSPADRSAAIQKLAAMLNALTLDERHALRGDHSAYKWFDQMTDAEKSAFLEATMPTGFKQTIAAFEKLPPDQRKRIVDQSVKQMRDARSRMIASGQMPSQNSNGPVLSQDLQDEVTKIGLQTYYSQSTAETKAELAPFLEEMQKTMESTRMLRMQRQP